MSGLQIDQILADMNFSGEIRRKEKVNCMHTLWSNNIIFMMLLPLYIPCRCLRLHCHYLQTKNLLSLE